MRSIRAGLATLVLSVAVLVGLFRFAAPTAELATEFEAPFDRWVQNGVAVELFLDGDPRSGPLLAGDTIDLRLRITDVETDQALRGLGPGAWMDLGSTIAGKHGEQESCKQRVGQYLQGLVGVRPMLDLNSYHLLVLNRDASISVIDPIVGMTGKTSLFASVLLRKPAADWVKDPVRRRVYVSMPLAGQVAVVDGESFRVLADVDAGNTPMRVALQADRRYLWVGNDDETESGVTVIDTETLQPVARFSTGAGHHEIAFDDRDRYAFVSNRSSGTVTVIDIAALRPAGVLDGFSMPISLAWSPLARAIYVADAATGVVSAIDPDRLEVVARMEAKPGLGPMRVSGDGRWGLVTNVAEQAVHVFDTASNRLVHTLQTPGRPYQIVMTRAYAYVRLLDSEYMQMIDLSLLGGTSAPPLASIAIGSRAPAEAQDLVIADSIASAATEAAVFVSDPADGATFYYMEGMNAPAGSFSNYGHAVGAPMVVDRSLAEVEPGVYAASARLPVAGSYQLAILLDTPLVLHCARFDVRENPAAPRVGDTHTLEFVDGDAVGAGGERIVRFRLRDLASHEARAGLRDVQVRAFVPSGLHRTEAPAWEIEPGLYETRLHLRDAGVWYVHVRSKALDIDYGELNYRSIVIDGMAAGTR